MGGIAWYGRAVSSFLVHGSDMEENRFEASEKISLGK